MYLHLIQAAINERRPVHLHLPIDVSMTEIDVAKPFQPETRDDQDVSRYIQMRESCATGI
jgi:TPP-dependent 2-oxoacid decarboxylase